MPQRFPVPHQLNAARGCVGKSGFEALWRPRGASAQNANESAGAAPGPHEARRARRSSMAGARVTVAGRAQGPEVGDDEPAPEIDDAGIPEPDVPEPDVPQPEVPEPEPPERKGPQPEVPHVVTTNA